VPDFEDVGVNYPRYGSYTKFYGGAVTVRFVRFYVYVYLYIFTLMTSTNPSKRGKCCKLAIGTVCLFKTDWSWSSRGVTVAGLPRISGT